MLKCSNSIPRLKTEDASNENEAGCTDSYGEDNENKNIFEINYKTKKGRMRKGRGRKQ